MTATMTDRRAVLRGGGALGLLAALSAAGFVIPQAALAEWNKNAFEAKTMEEALKAMGAGSAATSGEIQIVASDIAENGAVVPVQAVSKLAGTKQIAVLVEKNPNVLAAVFDIGPDVMPDVTTRIKMSQTSNVIVLVRTESGFATATKEIKVTLGGCGG